MKNLITNKMKKTTFTLKNCPEKVKQFFVDKAKETGSNSAQYEAVKVLEKHYNNNKKEFYGEQR